MNDSVQQIKDRLSIVDVISPYVELHQAGKNMKGKSPFTSEKTPSFYVSVDRGMYYCFSSSQGGDIFTFIEKMEGVDFKGALKILAEKAGVELTKEDPKKRNERDKQYAILEMATAFFEEKLKEDSEAYAYIIARGLNKETIKKWRIGYAPGPPNYGWRELREELQKKNFNDAEGVRAGLVKEPGAGKAPYDLFRDRIMFPISDPSGRVIAFSGRILSKDTESPKYVNTPDTELFNKSEALYGYHEAKNGIRTLGFSLVVEGQFDVVLAHQVGYKNTVAVSGTALTAHQVSLLQRLSSKVVLALDSDQAGMRAAVRAAEVMLQRGVDLKVASLPAGKDPADLIKEDKEEFKKIIKQSKHVIEYLLQVIKEETNDQRAYQLRAREEILPFILMIDNHIDRDHFSGVIAEYLDTTKDAILLELARIESSKDTKREPQRDTLSSPLEEKDHTPSARKDRVIAFLLTVATQLDEQLSDKIKAALQSVTKKDIDTLQSEVSAELMNKLNFMTEDSFLLLSRRYQIEELQDRLVELQNILHKESLATLKKQLVSAEQQSDEERVAEVMRQINELQMSSPEESAFDFKN